MREMFADAGLQRRACSTVSTLVGNELYWRRTAARTGASPSTSGRFRTCFQQLGVLAVPLVDVALVTILQPWPAKLTKLMCGCRRLLHT